MEKRHNTKEYKKLIESVFGESSDSEDEQLNVKTEIKEAAQIQSIFGENPNWERISKINGLSLCRDFLSSSQQSAILSSIHKEGWFIEASNNQAMRFGNLPAWACELSTSIREIMYFSKYNSEIVDIPSYDKDGEEHVFPPELLWREPLFNQLIVNLYQPGEGISAHVDLMQFEDGIGLISLESSCIMHFSRVETEACCKDGNDEGKGDSETVKVPVYLTPGSLLLMWGEARYEWKHEINRKPGFQKWEGKDIDQKRRISITLRKLCQME